MDTVWTERTMWHGAYQPIRDLILSGSHRVEAWGSVAEGWRPYLVTGGDGIGLPIGPTFHASYGDRLADLRAAAARVYNLPLMRVGRGRNFP